MANLITFLRFPLLFLYLVLIYFGGTTAQLWSIPLVAIIFFMDSVDGFIARLRGEVSLLGSAFDIATDRTMEIVLWVVFADLKLIPIAVPVIAIVRGTTVDAIRAVGIGNGLPAFDQVHHPVSRFLVSSRFMRDFYGVTKGLTFILLSTSLWARSSGSPRAGLINRARV
jgi:CDP-diacylglycerol--glycerol-3-phosphate 3-phosphatidyltransferase